MSVARTVVGVDHRGVLSEAHVHVDGQHSGQLVFTRQDLKFLPVFRPFLNETKGGAMNQNVGFTGKPTLIHAGVNSGALLTGTTDGTTTLHLIDAGTDFTTNIAIGMSVKNTTSGNEYALITAVASGDLTLDTDIFISGETYEINPIWVGTAVQGTWNFADSSKVTITSANDNDNANFGNDTNQSWDVSKNGFTTLTGLVDLDTYNPTTNDIVISFDLNGTAVGDSVSLNNIIDTANFTEQAFAIPVAEFNFGGDTIINGLTILVERAGGAKPTIKFDTIQWEETGDQLEYTVTPTGVERFHVTELRVALVDALAGTVTDGTMPGIDYSQLLGVTALSNGVVLQGTQNSKVIFSEVLTQLSSFLSTGWEIVNAISDGTNTLVTVLLDFPEPLILDGGANDFLSFKINDDLSGLIEFTATAHGALET